MVSVILTAIKGMVANQLVGLKLDIGDISDIDSRTFFPTLRVIRELELVGCKQHTVDAVANSGLGSLVKVVCLVGSGTTSAVYTTGDGVFGDKTLEDIGRSFSTLQELGIFNNYSITFAGLTGFVEHCTTLTRFQLQCCPYVGSDGVLALIRASPGLTHVSLGHSKATDSALMELASSIGRASRLRALSVAFSTYITTAGIRTIVDSCFNLEELDFELCPQVTLDVFSEQPGSTLGRQTIESLKCLRILRLSEQIGPLGSQVVIWLATRLPSLRWLELGQESATDDFCRTLMLVNQDIRIFIAGRRDHVRRALKRRHRYTEPPLPDPPRPSYASDWISDGDEDEDDILLECGIEEESTETSEPIIDVNEEVDDTSIGSPVILTHDIQEPEDLEYDDQALIDYQLSPPHSLGTDSEDDLHVDGSTTILPYGSENALYASITESVQSECDEVSSDILDNDSVYSGSDVYHIYQTPDLELDADNEQQELDAEIRLSADVDDGGDSAGEGFVNGWESPGLQFEELDEYLPNTASEAYWPESDDEEQGFDEEVYHAEQDHLAYLAEEGFNAEQEYLDAHAEEYAEAEEECLIAQIEEEVIAEQERLEYLAEADYNAR
ncbi:hypothetical protein BGX24_004388 [Mortierella sp. AD032]|nr:hypothetical protein BGX24_004388 [Mortierella sp. AD032]